MMKLRTRVLLVSMLLSCICLQSQTKSVRRENLKKELRATSAGSKRKIDNIIRYIEGSEKLYTCSRTDTSFAAMMTPLSFRKLLLPLYTKAAANDEGIVKNGTSFSYSYSEDKAIANINYLINFKDNRSWLLNISTSGSSDGSFIFISNKNKANYGFEVAPKLSYMLNRNSIYFDKKACEKLSEQRVTELYPLIIAKYQQLNNEENYDKIQRSIDNINEKLNIRSIISNNLPASKVKELSDSLKLYIDSLAFYTSFSRYNGDSLLKKVDSDIADFEVKNAVINGYTIHWIDVAISDKVFNSNIFDSTIFKANRITQKQFNRVTFSFNYNYMRNVRKLMLYLNAGFKLYNSYAIEGLKKETYNFNDTLGIEKSFKGYNNITNQNVNKNYLSTNLFVNLLMFFGQKKQWGFETSFDYTSQDQTAPISNARIGAVCSIIDAADASKSRSTVGVFLTLAQYDTSDPRMGDYMGVGFRLGIPLTTLINEKKK